MDEGIRLELDVLAADTRALLSEKLREMLTLHGDGNTMIREAYEHLLDSMRLGHAVSLDAVEQSAILDTRLKNLLTRYCITSDGDEREFLGPPSKLKKWDRLKFMKMRGSGVGALRTIEGWLDAGSP